jgi:hypothetical protein
MTVQYSAIITKNAHDRDQRKAAKREPQLKQAREIELNTPKIIETALAEWEAEEGTPLTIAQVCAHIRADNEKLESSQKLANLYNKSYSFVDRNCKTVIVSPAALADGAVFTKHELPCVTKEKSPFENADFYDLF